MTRVRWLAGRDGEAHARRGQDPRTLCGRVGTDERYAWPERGEPCPTCRGLALPLSLDALVAARVRDDESTDGLSAADLFAEAHDGRTVRLVADGLYDRGLR